MLIRMGVAYAFNKPSWSEIMEEMNARVVSKNILGLADNHIDKRKWVEDDVNDQSVPGVCVEPLWWNILYYQSLRSRVSTGAVLYQYADAVMVEGKSLLQVNKTNLVL